MIKININLLPIAELADSVVCVPCAIINMGEDSKQIKGKITLQIKYPKAKIVKKYIYSLPNMQFLNPRFFVF